jgi:large subunit ribosomal protein L24
MKIKIARNDMVEVIAGDDKGKRGRVLRVLRAEGRLVVEKVRLVKRHRKQMRATGGGMQGGIVEKEASIHASNVKVLERASNRAAVEVKDKKE